VLGPDSFLVRQRVSRIYYEGKFFSYPIKPLDALTKLGPIEAARCVASYVSVRLRPPADQATGVLGGRSFRVAPLSDVLQDLHRKSLGSPGEHHTVRLGCTAHQELVAPSAVLHAITSRLATTRHTSLIERFQYPAWARNDVGADCGAG